MLHISLSDTGHTNKGLPMVVGALAVSLVISLIFGTQVTFAATPNGATLNTHAVMVDGGNSIVSWVANQDQAYDTVIGLAWNYLLNQVPNDPSTGRPAYLSQSYINPDTQQMAGWPHNPAGLYGMLIEGALSHYAYSGNTQVLTLVRAAVDNHLQRGMTNATDNWSNVPYASGDAGSLIYKGASYGNSTGVGDGAGYLEPDKVGELGYGLIKLYEATGNTAYRDAAINAATALASHVRAGNATQSPWPFRVNAQTGAIREQYSAHVISPIELFDELIRLNVGDVALYQSARTTAWTWMMTYPMVNNNWSAYFEDVGVQTGSNTNQLNAMMVARYLLQHPEKDANWETHVRGLIAWVESTFGVAQYGALTIKEQQAFMYAMGSHTSRYASINALLYEKTGDLVAKEKAYRSFNWATYMARSSGVVIDGPLVNNQWFTDGYGDYTRHFMVGMAASPDFAPNGQNHLLRSDSVVTAVLYGPSQISYTTYDTNSTEVIKLASAPTGVTVNGVSLGQRSDLAAEGWVYDPTLSVLRVRHDNATNVVVALNGAPANQLPVVSITSPTTGSTLPAPASFTLQANASDSDGTVSKVEFYQNGILLGSTTTAPYQFAVASLAAGTYNFTARAYDNQNAAADSSPISVTVTPPLGAWTGVDIGPAGVPGSTSVNGGTFTVKGSGIDIWDASDSFHLGYQLMNGNGEIKARITAQQNTDPWALAGVMMRESLAANARHALAAITPGHGLSFNYRSTVGGMTTYVNGSSGTVPAWVRLVRAGNVFTAYKSTNGTAWTSMGSATIPMGTSVYVGLAVNSHNNSVLATDTFDNVSFTGGPPPADTTPPTISAVSAGSINQNGGTISWNTNEPATSQVEYGATTSYGLSTATNGSLDTAHAQVVSGLNASSTYHYRVRSTDAAGNTAVSGDNTFSTPPIPDTAAPTVSISTPASGATVSGTVPVSAQASDDIGVASVQFMLDGIHLGTLDTTAPYSINWGTTAVSNGAHVLTAIARDAAGNSSTSTNVSVNVDNVAPLPTATLSASPASVISGQSSTLSWGSTNATSCSGTNFTPNTTSGSMSVSPATTTSYGIVCTGAGGSANASTTIVVSTPPPPSTLSIDKTIFKDQTSGATVTTSAFSTVSPNELLLAFVSADAPNTGINTIVNSVTTTGLTWVLVKRTNTQFGTAEIWRAFATTTLTNVTVAATLSRSVASSMTVVTFTGSNGAGTGGAGAIGATLSASAASGAPTGTITTTRNNSWVFGVGMDWDSPTSRVVGQGQTMIHQYMPPIGDTYWVQRQNVPTPLSGTNVTINDTSPTNDRYNLSIVEIVPTP